MRSSCHLRSCCAALIVVVSTPSSAYGFALQEVSPPDEWRAPINNVLLGGIMVGTLAAVQLDLTDQLDKGIRPDPEGENSLFRKIPRLLDSYAVLAAAGATFIVGELADDRTTSQVGLHTLETLALTSLVTTAVKVTVGRSRPGFNREPDEFDSFNGSDDYWSFPSGHTSRGFALATVLTLELVDEASWIPYVAYPLATWVGATRVLDEKHWPTDVLAGAALGVLSAQIWHGIRRDEDAPGDTPVLTLRFPLGGG